MAVAAYLTFFPVTIASLRGLRAVDPRAARAVPLVRRDPAPGPLAAPPADVGARTCSRGFRVAARRVGHRRDHRRADRGRRRRASAARSSTTTSTTVRARSACGRRSSCARSSGFVFVGIVNLAERAPHAGPLPTRGGTAVTTSRRRRRPDAPSSRSPASARCSATGDARRDRPRADRPHHPPGRVRLAHRPVGLRQVDAAAAHRRPDPADQRDDRRQRQAGRPGPARPRLRDGLPGAGPDGLADDRQEHRAAARDHGLPGRRARDAGRPTCSSSSSSRRSPTAIRGSCRAACSSASRSPGPCRSTRSCCSWTSRSGRSTR